MPKAVPCFHTKMSEMAVKHAAIKIAPLQPGKRGAWVNLGFDRHRRIGPAQAVAAGQKLPLCIKKTRSAFGTLDLILPPRHQQHLLQARKILLHRQVGPFCLQRALGQGHCISTYNTITKGFGLRAKVPLVIVA